MEQKSKNIMWVIVAISIFILFLAIYIVIIPNGCGPSDPTPMDTYTVNEWGIFRQQYNSENITYFNGPAPGKIPMPEVVDQVTCKPVIYFHGDGLMDLKIDIEITAREIQTIPEANVTDDRISWDIQLAGDIYDEVDSAGVIDKNDDVYEYLFYEGIDEYYQNIIATITYNQAGNVQATIQNIGDFDISDAFLITEVVNGSSSDQSAFHIPLLESKDTINRSYEKGGGLDISQMRDTMKQLLEQRGLFDNETEDLLEYWIDGLTDENGIKTDSALTDPKGYNNAQFVFFISQDEYNEMLPITFSKNPSSVNRIGIIHISDIPITPP